jgi:hypothetical protein
MLILDISQIFIATLMVHLGPNPSSDDIDENLLRHLVLNSVRANKKEFSNKYGELVIACDSKESWRKKVFPYYKANRKKKREESKLDWNMIFASLDNIRSELHEYFPYRVIKVDGAEADDIIGTLVKKYHAEGIMILSGDHDFQQLQQYPRVEQYNPVAKKKIICNNPEKYLKEHIIRGDVGDGVPNMLSDDNCLVMGIRQKSVFAKKVDVWLDQEPEEFGEDYILRNFKRNQNMIDLDFIPEAIGTEILKEYDAQANKDTRKLFGYFGKFKLKNLMSDIGDF